MGAYEYTTPDAPTLNANSAFKITLLINIKATTFVILATKVIISILLEPKFFSIINPNNINIAILIPRCTKINQGAYSPVHILKIVLLSFIHIFSRWSHWSIHP